LYYDHPVNASTRKRFRDPLLHPSETAGGLLRAYSRSVLVCPHASHRPPRYTRRFPVRPAIFQTVACPQEISGISSLGGNLLHCPPPVRPPPRRRWLICLPRSSRWVSPSVSVGIGLGRLAGSDYRDRGCHRYHHCCRYPGNDHLSWIHGDQLMIEEDSLISYGLLRCSWFVVASPVFILRYSFHPLRNLDRLHLSLFSTNFTSRCMLLSMASLVS